LRVSLPGAHTSWENRFSNVVYPAELHILAVVNAQITEYYYLMAHDEHHEHLIKELAEQLEPVFSNSPQAIYLYLDDTHKICNQKFADMLGYSSIEEWVSNEAAVGDVLEEDQQKVIEAYGDASENFKASTFTTTFVKKDGVQLKTKVIMVPFSYKGEVFVLHFISEEK
jgi:PAS domain-containing protein